MSSTLEYVGGTGNALRARIMWHVRRALRGRVKQKVYKAFEALGVHQLIWAPYGAFKTVAERFTRMRKEGFYIWKRSSALTTLGTESTKELRVGPAMIVMGRGRRFRLVARLVDVVRGGWKVMTGRKEEEIR